MPNYRTTLIKVQWSLLQRGVVGTLKIGLGRLGLKQQAPPAIPPTHPFDLEYGVDTSGLIAGIRMVTGHKHDAYNTAYWGVAPSRAKEVLRRWVATPPARPLEDYTFLDVGCGKGRMVLLASELPFKQVVGVELCKDLAHTAAANVHAWTTAGRAKCPVQIMQQDATEMALPNGPCVVYLYNPFEAPVLRKLLHRLESQFYPRQQELDVLYLFPKCESVFHARQHYQLLWRAEIAQSEADRAVDPVSTSTHHCSAYRR